MSEEKIAALESDMAALKADMATYSEQMTKLHEKIEKVLTHVVEICSVSRSQLEDMAAAQLPELPTLSEERDAPINCGAPAPAAGKPMNVLQYFAHMWSTNEEFRTRYAAARSDIAINKKGKTPEEILKAEGRETHKTFKAKLPELYNQYVQEHNLYKAQFT